METDNVGINIASISTGRASFETAAGKTSEAYTDRYICSAMTKASFVCICERMIPLDPAGSTFGRTVSGKKAGRAPVIGNAPPLFGWMPTAGALLESEAHKIA